MKRLSPRAKRELDGVHPALVAVVKRAWTYLDADFEVIDGIRTLAEQKAYVRRGVSKTLRSYHLPQADGYGRAVDIVPLVNGVPKWPNAYAPWKPIEKAMKRAAKELGVPITWGGDWRNRWDKPHWQIPRRIKWDGPMPEPLEPSAQARPKYGDAKEFVRAFQRHHGLKEDGVAGPRTYAKLNT